ncbi:MAG: hypothetical protein LBI39_00235 [Puniceicoccales bacterium]|nr:hypothetical protein [Puniceicoccales bacterium]
MQDGDAGDLSPPTTAVEYFAGLSLHFADGEQPSSAGPSQEPLETGHGPIKFFRSCRTLLLAIGLRLLRGRFG